MNEKDAFLIVTKILRPFVRNEEKFKAADWNTRIWEDLQVNSARFIDILLAIEENLNMEIELDSFEGAATIGDVAKLLIEFSKKNPEAVALGLKRYGGEPSHSETPAGPTE